jgi:hypothetical protein
VGDFIFCMQVIHFGLVAESLGVDFVVWALDMLVCCCFCRVVRLSH